MALRRLVFERFYYLYTFNVMSRFHCSTSYDGEVLCFYFSSYSTLMNDV